MLQILTVNMHYSVMTLENIKHMWYQCPTASAGTCYITFNSSW